MLSQYRASHSSIHFLISHIALLTEMLSFSGRVVLAIRSRLRFWGRVVPRLWTWRRGRGRECVLSSAAGSTIP
eukprot:1974557-Rhodomonas_salina.4